MNAFLLELRSDHHHMMRVLKLIRYALSHVRKDHSAEHLDLLKECVNYMQSYPEQLHHPCEDMIFRYLVCHDDACRIYTESLQEEHDILARHNRELFHSIKELERGQTTDTGPLYDKGIHYTDLQIRHMRIEEDTVFPLVDKKLTISDWKKIINETDTLCRTKNIHRKNSFDKFKKAIRQKSVSQEIPQV